MQVNGGHAMRRYILASFIACLGMMFLSAPVRAASSARAQLQTIIPDAKLTNVPLLDALDFISNMTNANITVDWKTLEASNITKSSLVNLNLHSVRAGRLLTMILNEAAGGDTLTWYVDENVVHITTTAVADSQLVTVVYYIQDLIFANTPFNGQITGGNLQFSNTGGSGGGGSAQSSSIFSNSGQQSGADGSNPAGNAATTAQGLIKLIESIVRPEVWHDNNPDGKSSMSYFNGNLIVSAPRSVQEAIGGPLN
jgi:uncharacterized membrane protein YgcG